MTKKIFGICGSTRAQSTNRSLLNYLKEKSSDYDIRIFNQILSLPPFDPETDKHPLPESVVHMHNLIKESDAILIITPEYLGSIPAALKNLLEWNNKRNLLSKKACIHICYTPKSPRGERCLEHLSYALKSLDADIKLAELLHHDQISFNENRELKEYNLDYPLEEILNVLN